MKKSKEQGFFLLATLAEATLALLLTAAATLSFSAALNLLKKERQLQAALGYGQLLLWSAAEGSAAPPGLEFEVKEAEQGRWRLKEVSWKNEKGKEAGNLFLAEAAAKEP